MRHAFIDEYSARDTILRRRDPRAKIAVFFFFVLGIIATPAQSFHTFGLFTLVLAVLVVIAELPLTYVVKRAAAAVPFILCMVLLAALYPRGVVVFCARLGCFELALTHAGLLMAWNMTIKALLSMVCMTLLVSSTPFSDLLKGLESLKVPALFVMIISFMYRYFFVLEDELEKMLLARQSRTVRVRRQDAIRVLSNMVGVLFIRSYERAEAVYAAMRCRGFDGSIHTLHDFRFTKRDAYFVAGAIIVLTTIVLTGV